MKRIGPAEHAPAGDQEAFCRSYQWRRRLVPGLLSQPGAWRSRRCTNGAGRQAVARHPQPASNVTREPGQGTCDTPATTAPATSTARVSLGCGQARRDDRHPVPVTAARSEKHGSRVHSAQPDESAMPAARQGASPVPICPTARSDPSTFGYRSPLAVPPPSLAPDTARPSRSRPRTAKSYGRWKMDPKRRC